MKVTMSSFLNNKKVLATVLVDRLLETYDYASILGADTKGHRYGVKKSGVNLDESMWVERGFVVRVYNGSGYSEHSFNDLEENDLDGIVSMIHESVANLKKLTNNNAIEVINYNVIEEEVLEKEFLAQAPNDLTDISHEEKLSKMHQIMEATLELGDELIDTRISYEEVHVSKIFISKNKSLAQSYIWSNGAVIPIAQRDGRIKYCVGMISGLEGAKLLEEVDQLKEKAAIDTLSLLDSTNVESGEYDIILDPDIAGLVAHEAFGHGVEMDMYVKNRAKAAMYMDKEVASMYVDMYDGANSHQEVSSYLFDDEGNLGTSTKIIDGGILKNGIVDALSAMQLGIKPSGNGKRQSFENKVYTRMTNTFFDKGDHTLDEMIASIDKGYLLEGFTSGMEDPKNWGIQCIAALGREIIDGKLTGKIISPVFLTGYVPDLLKSITMTSNELRVIGNGTCGKGYKEYVKTSTGGPYIKARGKLS